MTTAPLQARSSSMRLATAALIGYAYFVCAVVLLHVLRSDYDPRWNFLSDYAVGDYGFIMKSAFFAFALGMLFLVIALIHDGPKNSLSWIGFALFSVVVPGLVVSGLFDADVSLIDPNAPRLGPTQHGLIHYYSAMVNFSCLPLGALLVSIGARWDTRWRSFHVFGTMLALALIGAFFLQMASIQIETRQMPLAGMANRGFAALMIVWLTVAARHFRRLDSRPQ